MRTDISATEGDIIDTPHTDSNAIADNPPKSNAHEHTITHTHQGGADTHGHPDSVVISRSELDELYELTGKVDALVLELLHK